MQTNSTSASNLPTHSRQAPRDIVDSLKSAGVVPRRILELDQGRALAQWQNHQGQVQYERPRHHALSIYIDKGEQARRVMKGKVVSQGFPGAVCLFPAGSRSTWEISGPFEFFHFYFNDLDITRCAEQTFDSDPNQRQLAELYHGEDPVLAEAGRLLTLSDWQAPGQTMAMDHLAQWLLLQIVCRHANVPQAPPDVTGKLSLRYRRLLQERVNAQLDQPLTLAAMASWVNLSPYHFARLFKATFGCAPYQYVQEQRLIRARDMLRLRDNNITAIALTCGFNDSSQFSRAFKTRFGITPSGYRAANQPTRPGRGTRHSIAVSDTSRNTDSEATTAGNRS
ncbi:helix-turn-helix domain-containing protein [Marinobacter sp. F3R08]|uniref:helix-turn-helix domain-containing protein n=1 Tax=Marinobacter sp. F3R08 TaxID=2841559 RepID=UPI001C0A5DA2|nr:AraC family transcriptional regulator [Marinobacter sp. F3R08]MBU2953764.1 AraC family transcriptional regulator [Marinobacter sp. F3R08]